MNIEAIQTLLVLALIVGFPAVLLTALLLRWMFRINAILQHLDAIRADQKRQADATEALLKAVAPAAPAVEEPGSSVP